MPRARCNGIEIEYDSFGPEDGRPLLLVMGLGTQMIHWDPELCSALAERGHRVVRFDNRDVGLSTRFESAGVPDLPRLFANAAVGIPPEAPYRLSDMAADAAGLLDHLGLQRAHVVGASMGGMIAQTLAIEHPQRVASLVSIMSTTGARDLPPAKPEAMARLTTPAPTERAAYIEHSLGTSAVMGTDRALFPFDEARVRARAAEAFDRAFYPQGSARQLAAIVASGSRREALASVRCPTLVIHGKTDALVPFEGGLDTQRAIPGASALWIEGMGHDLPRGAWPAIVDAISELTQVAARAA